MELTRKKVMAMEAGREMDRLIGARVMKFVQLSNAMLPDGTTDHTPNYSTDISAAWEVLETFNQANVMKSKGWKEQYDCRIWVGITGDQWLVRGETAPLAICKAALLSTLTEQD